MDGYVRMFDGLFIAPDDNPTIGLILCTEKCDTAARYSVLNDQKQIFASKFLPSLPSEEQLRAEIEKERKLIEASLKTGTLGERQNARYEDQTRPFFIIDPVNPVKKSLSPIRPAV